MPPDFDPNDMRLLKEKYNKLFGKGDGFKTEDDENETTEVMKAISDTPTTKDNQGSKEMKQEHNRLLQTLYDSNGIKTSFNHDKVEKSVLDRKIIREGANMIASRAVAAVKASAKERASHYISQPTWTGRRGSAGGGSYPATPKQERDVVKKERDGPTIAGGVIGKAKMEKAGVSSADILEGLRQLAAIRSMNGGRQSEDAARLGLQTSQGNSSSSSSSGAPTKADLDLPIELH